MKAVSRSIKTKYSDKITTGLLEEIHAALSNVKGWGSVEIFVQNGKVTQITQRSIKKTDHPLSHELS